MTDKVQKIRGEVERLMYGFNMEADIASCENAETEKLADIKYQLCKKILDYIDKVQEEPVSEDLEQFCAEYERKVNYDGDIYTNVKIRNAIKAGVNWKKQQLIKNVVLETDVLRDSDGDGVDTPYESWLTLANTEIPELPESLGLKEGDKVKIVIVKSE